MVRQSLRQRGWLEKEYKCSQSPQKVGKDSKSSSNTVDDNGDDSDVDEPLCLEGYEEMTREEEEEWTMLVST